MLGSASQIITETFQLYRDHFRLILKYLLVLIGVWLVLALNSLFGLSSVISVMDNWAVRLAAVLLQFAIIGGFLVVSISLNRAVSAAIRQQTIPSLWMDLKSSLRILLPTILASALLTIATFFGMILFIVPGIIFALWFYFAPYATMLDGAKPVAAMNLSRHLVTGRFGQVLWLLTAPIVVYLLFFTLGIWAIVTPGQYLLAATGNLPAYYLAIVLGIIFYFLLFPIITISPLLLYEKLRATAK